ncbi:UBC core domain-containing protein [Caenorhabditis elegans]|uniref:UBC core domain-containing protein n=1 Tax=Caenorhabditis elegans TaxID=6239 RepID=G5EC28_CAEEL|nr:UBC core domain-containing protein [Caenorhabditis elegans]NP_504004.2 UBC core domain-containing protein [Caenorhabditis elegans]CCD63578.2 UBC core domain-containing protein [Caenorhabditis elegans]CCD70893.2 UBC core domain-containing protein [Caenorhabditis elegans]|eukprot:NP_504003.3 Uncharacterized protein CELE_T24A6.17 [Caenorhabditis elegans]
MELAWEPEVPAVAVAIRLLASMLQLKTDNRKLVLNLSTINSTLPSKLQR